MYGRSFLSALSTLMPFNCFVSAFNEDSSRRIIIFSLGHFGLGVMFLQFLFRYLDSAIRDVVDGVFL